MTGESTSRTRGRGARERRPRGLARGPVLEL